VLRGEELPAIHPLVDLNNCLSIALAVPSCVMAAGSFGSRVRLRRGIQGERFDSLRGDFDLEDKVLLEDSAGPFGTPITDSRRVKVEEATTDGWLVAYLPLGGIGPEGVERVLGRLDGIAAASGLFASAGPAPSAAGPSGPDRDND
jgi:DNA/RNA-binding domain of Phe-tRNA-synthetase-like protein